MEHSPLPCPHKSPPPPPPSPPACGTMRPARPPSEQPPHLLSHLGNLGVKPPALHAARSPTVMPPPSESPAPSSEEQPSAARTVSAPTGTSGGGGSRLGEARCQSRSRLCKSLRWLKSLRWMPREARCQATAAVGVTRYIMRRSCFVIRSRRRLSASGSPACMSGALSFMWGERGEERFVHAGSAVTN